MFGARGVALGLKGGVKLNNLGKKDFQTYAPRYRMAQTRQCLLGGPVTALASETLAGRDGQSNELHHHPCEAKEEASKAPPVKTVSIAEPGADQKFDMEQDPEDKEKQMSPVAVKSKLTRRVCLAACRITILGVILISVGTAMCVISWYKDHFAQETVVVSHNVTTVTVSATKRFQFQTLMYVGPVIMGVGAFILITACVTTLEARDKHARICSRASLGERAPLSRRPTQKKSIQNPPPPCLKRATADSEPVPQQATASKDTNNNRGHQPAELMAVEPASGGVVNRCFTRDDSKTASKPDTDSGPYSTTTTTLTWSKNGVPKCETDVCKFSSSTSCIDSMTKKSDARALLQRFLEDQSQLVEGRLQRKGFQTQKLHSGAAGGAQADEEARSASLDAPSTEKLAHACRNVKSEDLPSGRNIVAAEVHRAKDASPRPKRASPERRPDIGGELRAPIIPLDAFENYSIVTSPMSTSPDTPASTVRRAYRDEIMNSRQCQEDNPPSASSYFTVSDEMADVHNANLNTDYAGTTDRYLGSLYGEVPNANAGSTGKLYDSVFLAENLRRSANAISNNAIEPEKDYQANYAINENFLRHQKR